MKIRFDEQPFQPLAIVIESEEELNELYALLSFVPVYNANSTGRYLFDLLYDFQTQGRIHVDYMKQFNQVKDRFYEWAKTRKI